MSTGRGLPRYLAVLIPAVFACSRGGATTRDPATPPPVSGPAPGVVTAPATAANTRSSGRGSKIIPTRPEQAPFVTVQQIVGGKIAFGRRVRVGGRCVAATPGRAAGLWTLADRDGAEVEVRGLVPRSCKGEASDTLTIFAQVEPIAPGSRERLLLRLPS